MGHRRRRRRCRLRLRVSWCGSWAHRNVSCGSRGNTGGMRQRRFKVELKLVPAGGWVAAWLVEIGLRGNQDTFYRGKCPCKAAGLATPLEVTQHWSGWEELRLKWRKSKNTYRQKVTERYMRKSAIYRTIIFYSINFELMIRWATGVREEAAPAIRDTSSLCRGPLKNTKE